MTDNKHTDALIKIVYDTLLQLQRLINQDQSREPDFLEFVKTFLLNTVSTTISLAEAGHPGSAPLLYTEMEAEMRNKALREMAAFSAQFGSVLYSATSIDENDKTGGMNYIGQQLVVTLFRSLCELPKTMRNDDMVLRAIGVLLVNLLNKQFAQNAHQVLDRLCAHVHLVLDDLTKQTMH